MYSYCLKCFLKSYMSIIKFWNKITSKHSLTLFGMNYYLLLYSRSLHLHATPSLVENMFLTITYLYIYVKARISFPAIYILTKILVDACINPLRIACWARACDPLDQIVLHSTH